MSRAVSIPFFAEPPASYDRAYFAQLARAFAVYTQQMNTPGPWRATELTLTEQTGNVTQGQLAWSEIEGTVDLTMGGGVVQQVGFDTYMRGKNDTGALIPKGAVVGFAGVNSEIKAAPYTANSAANELYFIGVTARALPDQDVGPVQLYGKIKGLDTTGPGAETWSVGDILYASPTTAGGLTNIRPTAPDVVLSVAVVLSVSAVAGEIMVRPTIPIGLDYGVFDSSANQTLSATNTATAVIVANALVSNGVSVASGARITASRPGLYRVSADLQLISGSSSAKTAYFWLRKNGADVPDTTRVLTMSTNAGFVPLALNYTVSLLTNDYVELYWAADDTNVTLGAVTAPAFAPAAPSVLVNVTQLQL